MQRTCGNKKVLAAIRVCSAHVVIKSWVAKVCTMARYMTHCCCNCMTVKTGTLVLAILSVIGHSISLVTYSAICANFNKILATYDQNPELQEIVKSGYGIFVAYAVISAVGLTVAALCIRGAYADQRHLLLPYLVFEGLLLFIMGITIIILIVAIVGVGMIELIMLLLTLMLALALQIYFFLVVLSFYKQLAFAGHNPPHVGMTPGPVPSTYMTHPGYPEAPPHYQPPESKMAVA